MYVFIDTETTGLDPRRDLILEVGILAIEDDLRREIGHFRKVVKFNAYVNGKPRPEISEFVFKMHEKTKLWEECANSYMMAKAVENAAVKFMEPFKGIEMAGSTISFDRAFLHEQMPELERCFHYRNIDVSTYKALQRYGVEVPPKQEAHRALADCRESAANLRYYLTQLGLLDRVPVGKT